MNRRQNAVIFNRKYSKKNGKISTWYWYYIYDEAGKRKAYPLYTQSKTEAKLILDEKKASGELVPTTGDNIPFKVFAEPFWTNDRCPYIRMKRLRGERITKKNIDQNRSYLDNHIVPALGSEVLGVMTPAKIEAFLLTLREEKNLANKTINNVLSCIRVLTAEAVRGGYIESDPAKSVRPLLAKQTERGMLTSEEVRKLFLDPEKWRSPVVYAINLAAATTGARLGELRGIKARCVQQGRIVIDGVYREGEGYIERDTKTGASGLRIIPIPKITWTVLSDILQDREPEAFVFSLDGGKKPIGANVATRALQDALEKCGVMTAVERSERHITFHSWRHFFNSMLRGKISDTDLRQVTGHTTGAMTDHYSHRLPEHIDRFAAAQEQAVGQIAR